jgi:hypothetical protein
VEILRDRLGADEHAVRGQPLMAALNDVGRALSSWPAPYTSGCPGWDTQVFTWQQRALGQVLRTGGSDATHVMTYAEYLAEQGTVEQHAQPLTRLLVDISPSPEGNCRWQRLLAVQTALGIVQAQCENLVIQRDGSADRRRQRTRRSGQGAGPGRLSKRSTWRAVPRIRPTSTSAG